MYVQEFLSACSTLNLILSCRRHIVSYKGCSIEESLIKKEVKKRWRDNEGNIKKNKNKNKRNMINCSKIWKKRNERNYNIIFQYFYSRLVEDQPWKIFNLLLAEKSIILLIISRAESEKKWNINIYHITSHHIISYQKLRKTTYVLDSEVTDTPIAPWVNPFNLMKKYI